MRPSRVPGVAAWRHTPNAIRQGAMIAWTLAAILTWLGIQLDGRDWWANHAFLLNLASSLTAFLAGAPLAVIAFSALVDRTNSARATHAELDKVQDAARRVQAQLDHWIRDSTDSRKADSRSPAVRLSRLLGQLPQMTPDVVEAITELVNTSAPALAALTDPGPLLSPLLQDTAARALGAYLAEPTEARGRALAAEGERLAQALLDETSRSGRRRYFGIG